MADGRRSGRWRWQQGLSDSAGVKFWTEGVSGRGDGPVHAVLRCLCRSDDAWGLAHLARTLGIVGESGSGKSVSVLSLIQLIPNPPGEVSEGEIYFKGNKIFDGKELADVKALPRYKYFDGINRQQLFLEHSSNLL